MLEIELNENLKRKKLELEGSIEMLTEAPQGDSTDGADIETISRRISALETSIDRVSNEIKRKSIVGRLETFLTDIASRNGGRE